MIAMTQKQTLRARQAQALQLATLIGETRDLTRTEREVHPLTGLAVCSNRVRVAFYLTLDSAYALIDSAGRSGLSATNEAKRIVEEALGAPDPDQLTFLE